jgi:hypothetical protein
MQLLLSFAQSPVIDAESEMTGAEPEIWTALPNEQRSEAVTLLARLLAKAAVIETTQNANPKHDEENDDRNDEDLFYTP